MSTEEGPPRNPSEAEQGTRDPAEIRKDIEQARGEVGDTVAAIAAKSDIKGQAKDKAAEFKGEASAKASQVKGLARENPVPAAILGALLALLILRRLRSR
jgi:hypothetical protein